MRKVLGFFLLYWTLFAVSAVADANAQRSPGRSTRSVKTNLVDNVKYFASGQACLQALQNGTARFYTPSFHDEFKPVSAGEEQVALEGNACVLMMTVKGFRWVAQKEDDLFVMKNKVIVRRFDCGNPIKEVLYPGRKEIVQVQEEKCPEGTTPIAGSRRCLEVQTEKVTETVEVEVPVDKPVYVNPCPTDIGFDGSTSLKSRLTGGLIQAGISTGASIGITKARGGDWRDAARSGAYGLGMQRVQQAINASQDGIRLVIPSMGIDQKIPRGRTVELGNGLSVHWDGGTAYVVRNVEGNVINCSAFGLRKASNMGVWTDGRRKTTVPTVVEPTKTPSQIPTRPRTIGGQFPTTGGTIPAGTPGTIPTRPRRDSFAPTTGGSTTSSSQALVCKNKWGGVIPCR